MTDRYKRQEQTDPKLEIELMVGILKLLDQLNVKLGYLKERMAQHCLLEGRRKL